ncbi:MAG: sulfur carrier protein ThiS [Myxococcota bacterium]|nr:sulfur carrier protein ThiS [Myxococcota bacterium]
MSSKTEHSDLTDGMTIQVTVNGFPEQVPVDATIAAIIEQFEAGDSHLIVEHNGRLLRPDRWSHTCVKPNDTVELIHPCFGG